jgi:hypothetical protein
VEHEAGFDWLGAYSWVGHVEVAVGGGAHGAAGEVAAAVEFGVSGDEDVVVVVGVEVELE